MKIVSCRSFASTGLIAILIIAGCAPAFAANVQKKPAPPKKPAPAPVLRQPATPYGQGYQKGYAEGFAQGEVDWSNNARADFRRSDRWQQRDGGSSDEYRLGYELGFELAYADGYYGRGRNAEVPRNGEVIAKAAALAEQQRRDGIVRTAIVLTARARTVTARTVTGRTLIAASATRIGRGLRPR